MVSSAFSSFLVKKSAFMCVCPIADGEAKF